MTWVGADVTHRRRSARTAADVGSSAPHGHRTGAERVAVMVPTQMSGGGRAVAAEVDMAADPPTADLSVTSPTLDVPLRVDASVGSTFDAEGTTYQVVRVCESGLDVVPTSG